MNQNYIMELIYVLYAFLNDIFYNLNKKDYYIDYKIIKKYLYNYLDPYHIYNIDNFLLKIFYYILKSYLMLLYYYDLLYIHI